MKKMRFPSIAVALFLLQLAFTCNAQIVTDSLIAMYSFNNGTAEDDIGPWDGTAVNATLVPDRFGNPNQAYWLNGNDDSYIKLGTTSVLKPTECSISMWVREDSLMNNGSGYPNNTILITKCQAGNNFFEAYAFYYYMPGNQMAAATTLPPANQQVVFSQSTTLLHDWHHLVMTFDFDSLKFYVDGLLQGALLKNYTTIYLLSDSVMVGNSCNVANSRYYRGAVDDIRFYNRVITPLEVDSLFNEKSDVKTNVQEQTEIGAPPVMMYPNPFSSTLVLDFKKRTIGKFDLAIQNILGQIVYMNNQIDPDGIKTIDLKQLPDGIYFLDLIIDGEKMISKIVKQ